MFQPNLIICPKCNHYFSNNVINGLELIDVVSRITSRMRMYSKLTLDSIERSDRAATPRTHTELRKIILDNYNDFNRDVQTILGFGTEVE